MIPTAQTHLPFPPKQSGVTPSNGLSRTGGSSSWAEQAWESDRSNTLRRFGFAVAAALVFIRFSELGEILEYVLGARAYLVMILGPIAVLLLVGSGGIMRSLRERPAYFFSAYIAWLLVCAPFSVWKGGTFAVLRPAFSTEFSMYFIVAGLILTLEEVHKMVKIISLAVTVDLLVLLKYGDSSGGRLSMAFGTLQNPNDLAVHLIAAIPFVLLSIRLWPAVSVGRFLALVTVPGSLYVVLLTGSRMGMLSLAVTVVFLLMRASMRGRVVMVATLVPLAVVGFMLLPQAARQRYLSVFQDEQVVSSQEELAQLQGATGSTEARLELLKASVGVTLANPLFGVGPGQFAVEEAEIAKREGHRGRWQVTHNTYTEISSEAGIPALCFFVGAIIGTLLMLNSLLIKVRRLKGKEVIEWSLFYTMLSLFGFAACSFFGSMGYRFYMPTLVAFGVCVASVSRRELALAMKEASTPVPQPIPSSRPSAFLPALAQPKQPLASRDRRISPLRFRGHRQSMP